ncbi:hypothetical protein V6N12_066830 [Hibiscus sabdariffa]|uniref:Uncharacterized protein n=1 Tax=Hibiscus sabdariffa TaxID=183260 RepID=A0ABR2C9A1_9ROSI
MMPWFALFENVLDKHWRLAEEANRAICSTSRLRTNTGKNTRTNCHWQPQPNGSIRVVHVRLKMACIMWWSHLKCYPRSG